MAAHLNAVPDLAESPHTLVGKSLDGLVEILADLYEDGRVARISTRPAGSGDAWRPLSRDLIEVSL